MITFEELEKGGFCPVCLGKVIAWQIKPASPINRVLPYKYFNKKECDYCGGITFDPIPPCDVGL